MNVLKLLIKTPQPDNIVLCNDRNGIDIEQTTTISIIPRYTLQYVICYE